MLFYEKMAFFVLVIEWKMLLSMKINAILQSSMVTTKLPLLIHHLHVTPHHAGPSTLMAILAANYYVLRARLAVRNVVRCCVICRRRNFKTILQKMGHHLSLIVLILQRWKGTITFKSQSLYIYFSMFCN